MLSTMLSGNPAKGIGEWGFSALVEVDGARLLVDTGARPETVLRNATELGIDLSTVQDVVLTHNHGDHVGGLLTLRRELAKRNPDAMSRAHVAEGIFLRRLNEAGRDVNGLLPDKAAYEALGGKFIESATASELFPNVWLTGPVPRPHPERNWTGFGTRTLQTPDGPLEDTVPESNSVVIQTTQGLVVISGCGHAGIINTVEYARQIAGAAPLHAVIGGFHLFNATDETLSWTGEKLKELGVRHLLGAHCTGIEAVYRLRAATGLTRKTAVVGAVGSTYTLGQGIDPLAIAG